MPYMVTFTINKKPIHVCINLPYIRILLESFLVNILSVLSQQCPVSLHHPEVKICAACDLKPCRPKRLKVNCKDLRARSRSMIECTQGTIPNWKLSTLHLQASWLFRPYMEHNSKSCVNGIKNPSITNHIHIYPVYTIIQIIEILQLPDRNHRNPIPSGKQTQLWKITIFNGQINGINGHFQQQSVSLPVKQLSRNCVYFKVDQNMQGGAPPQLCLLV